MLKPDPAHPRYAEAMELAHLLAEVLAKAGHRMPGLTYAEMVDELAHGSLRKWDLEAARPTLKEPEDDPVAREKVAAFMIAHSFATGHGDTLDNLLMELGWQIDELREERQRFLRTLQANA